ncbi:hypothetical protein [Pseudomonas sp. 18175]|uniref:hypothetical protein n=1 Tax=Pseudomonas sp. 18175 TaxID=3390056 RepID=UPI003D204409
MNYIDQGLFKGVAVVIDDMVHVGGDKITTIVKSIRDGGGHVITLDALPNEDVDLGNFANAAFFIMDWDLSGTAVANALGEPPTSSTTMLGINMPAGLKNSQADLNIDFLKRLAQHRHAPVFIFTNDSVAEVEAVLQLHQELYCNAQESHILVKNKSDVGDQVYKILNDWAQEVPSVIALKNWEKNHLEALNALFVDFHDRSRFWPVILWQTFAADGIDPSEELGRLITRLVTSRMKPLNIDLAGFEQLATDAQKTNPEQYTSAIMKVLEGERFVRNERIEPSRPVPGDVFLVQNQTGSPTYYVNVRAECDLVIRKGKTSNPELYLLKGREIQNPLDGVSNLLGNLPERDNQATIFAMYEGRTISFNFNDLKIKQWNTIQPERIGRLLAPFSTRLFQRYAAYGQRPGLPRIPPALFPEEAIKKGDSPSGCEASACS